MSEWREFAGPFYIFLLILVAELALLVYVTWGLVRSLTGA